MSSCGSGKSSKGGGSKSKGKSSKGDALHKKVSIKTEKHHLTTLRTALRDELGGDRDVLSSFGAFTKYDREGLALDVHFRTGNTITDDELDWAEDLVHRNLKPLGHGGQGVFTCPGGYDDDEYKRCSYRSNFEARPPWTATEHELPSPKARKKSAKAPPSPAPPPPAPPPPAGD